MKGFTDRPLARVRLKPIKSRSIEMLRNPRNKLTTSRGLGHAAGATLHKSYSLLFISRSRSFEESFYRGESVANCRRMARISIGKNIFVRRAKGTKILVFYQLPIFLPANILANSSQTR